MLKFATTVYCNNIREFKEIALVPGFNRVSAKLKEMRLHRITYLNREKVKNLQEGRRGGGMWVGGGG